MLLSLRLPLPIRVVHHTATATVRILLVDTTNSHPACRRRASDLPALPALSFVFPVTPFLFTSTVAYQLLSSTRNSLLFTYLWCVRLTHAVMRGTEDSGKGDRQHRILGSTPRAAGAFFLFLDPHVQQSTDPLPPLLILLPVRVCTPFSSATAAATVQILLVANGMTHFLCLCNPSQTDECR